MKMRRFIFHLLITFLAAFIACDRSTEQRKIKLSDENTATRTEEQLTTTIHLEPTLRRAIAVMFFDNQTGDENLEWLQKGLTEMFIRALSQSQYLSVISTDRLHEILERLGKTAPPEEIDLDMAAVVAKEANVEALLTGNISRSGDSLKINVKVHEPNRGQILKEESIEGHGLENIFSMVDRLTQRIKNDLQLTLEKDGPSRGIAELSTHSLEAWRHYTSGVDFAKKLLYADAVSQLEKAVEKDSTFVSAHLELCSQLLNQHEIQRANDIFQKLHKLKYKSTQQENYQISLLESHFRRDLPATIHVLQQWLDEYPDDRDANMRLATTYFGLHNYDQSIHHYRRILDIDPKYKLAYNQLGYIYAYKGDYDKAIAILEKYKKLAPDESNPYDSLGEIYLFMGEYKKAEKHFKKALEVNENFMASLLGLGNIYLDRGKYRKALKHFEQYLEKAGDRSTRTTAYAQIALTHWRLGETEEAIASYRKLLETSVIPYSAADHMNEIYLEKSDTSSAVQSLKQNYDLIKKSIEKDETLISSLIFLSLWHDVNVDETINMLEQMIKSSKNLQIQMQGHFYLTLLYMKTDQLEELDKLSRDFTQELIEILKEVRAINFNETWKHYLILNRFYRQYFEEGITNYNQLIKLFAENKLNMPEMVFRLFLTDLYLYAGDTENAEQQLRTVGMPEEKEWMIIGPFDNNNGFQKQYPPEKKIKINRAYHDKSQSIRWQHPDDGFNEGYVNLRQIYEKSDWSVVYGLIYIECPETKNVQFRLGTNESVKLWLNDEKIWRLNRLRGAIFDDDIVHATLQPGLNKILIKVCNRISEFGFYFRVTDEDGIGIPDIRFVSPDRTENLS